MAFPNAAASVPPQATPTLGPVLTFEPNPPNAQANSVAALAYADQWALLGKANAAMVNLNPGSYLGSCEQPGPTPGELDCYNHPWTEYPGNSFPHYQTQYPWKAVGKLFFHEADESPTDDYHHCTAQVISGPPKNLIVTAAHCVSNPNTLAPHKDWVFVPAEMSGTKPYGEFQYNLAIVGPGWIKNPGSQRYDVALLSLQNDAQGYPVSFYTGTLGLKLNLPYTQQLTLMGYSVAQVSKGVSTTINTGQSFQLQDANSCPGYSSDNVLLIGSDLSYGASGGAWIYQFYPFDNAALVGNYVTSVVSGGVLCQSGPMPTAPNAIMAGPHFSDDNIGALCTAIGGCGVPARAECVFDWAKSNIEYLYYTTATSTQFSSLFAYRTYTDALNRNLRAYLGVSAADRHMYYMLTDGILHDVGPLSDWAAKAGCP